MNGMKLAILGAIMMMGAKVSVIAADPKPFGLEKIVALVYFKGDARAFKSANVVSDKDWKYWQSRGGLTVVNHTWFDILLDTTVEKGAAVLTGINYGDNPRPIVGIDEFGFDEGGQTDQKSAQILEEVKKRKPGLGLIVYQMRGPISTTLAPAYKKVVDLVAMEAYVGDKSEYWRIASQLAAARMHGFLYKAIVLLGLGKGDSPGHDWILTREELEQQIKFVRMIAPESPGIGFFGGGVDPAVIAYADELCGKFLQLPTDGAGLPKEALELHTLFNGKHEKPVLVAAGNWVEPDRSFANPRNLVVPYTFRALIMNVGGQDAKDVKVRLLNPKDKGGDVFAEGTVSLIPKQNLVTAVLPCTSPTGEVWKVWKTWDMQIESAGCEIVTFPRQ